MSENKINLEQPLSVENLTLNSQGKQGLQQVMEDNVLQEENKNGVELELSKIGLNLQKTQNADGSNNLGKFKNSDSLLSSYNALQSDYTKKCQALKELTKQIEEQNLLKLEEENKQKEFENNSKTFFENNLRAKKFEKELTQMILKDKELSDSQTPFETAWKKFLENNFYTPDELISDENFLKNYVFNSEKIKEQIISQYFSGLKINSSPILISNQKGSKTILSPVDKPKSIKDAGKLAEEMFLS
ncbi:MAG: hypothetical protein IKI95_02280 [Clostridia bacterium]|nr:hypothetical protein [Clostridia bacterium]